ncbi:MAG TPA: hypothetical protein VML55_26755 [Planctomycetaceae bacterium]|nr:hypothetical protein [Planctomycetaceae bacterium]
MRTASNGFSATLLLLVPLLAVPFLAAVGLPQFSGAPAAASVDPPDLRPVHRSESRPSAWEDRVGESARPSADDLFAPFDTSDRATRATSYAEPDDGPVVRLDAFETGLRAEPQQRDARAATDLTWAAAVRRMKELGIEDFRLSPGDTENQFHFCCQLEAEADSGVMHRFEAEAAEPLAAVADAIEQAEGWFEQTAGRTSPLEGELARLSRAAGGRE